MILCFTWWGTWRTDLCQWNAHCCSCERRLLRRSQRDQGNQQAGAVRTCEVVGLLAIFAAATQNASHPAKEHLGRMWSGLKLSIQIWTIAPDKKVLGLSPKPHHQAKNASMLVNQWIHTHTYSHTRTHKYERKRVLFVFFWIWLILLNPITSSSIHFPENYITSFS